MNIIRAGWLSGLLKSPLLRSENWSRSLHSGAIRCIDHWCISLQFVSKPTLVTFCWVKMHGYLCPNNSDTIPKWYKKRYGFLGYLLHYPCFQFRPTHDLEIWFRQFKLILSSHQGNSNQSITCFTDNGEWFITFFFNPEISIIPSLHSIFLVRK